MKIYENQGEKEFDANGCLFHQDLLIYIFICVSRAEKRKKRLKQEHWQPQKADLPLLRQCRTLRPVPDTAEQMEWFVNSWRKEASVKVLPYAAITSRQLGKELVDFTALKEAGAFRFYR